MGFFMNSNDEIRTIVEYEQTANAEGRVLEVLAFLLNDDVTVEDKDEKLSLQIKRLT